MTLEDFFTLTEMKDGLTAPARVEELVSVMKKDKNSFVKNVGDATRQWAAVASTIAATENKECLDLFVQLDGLWFIDKWLKDAQTFATEVSDCFVEEAISALLQAVEKLQIDNERLISSGICITVKNLLSYKSTRVQDKARALFDNWKAKDVSVVSMCVEKSAACHPEPNNEHPESHSAAADDVLLTRSVGDQKLERIEGGMSKISNDQDSSQITSDHVDAKDGSRDTVASPVRLKCVEGEMSAREEVCPSDGKVEQQCTSDLKQGTTEVISEVLKIEHVAEDARQETKFESVPDRLGKVEDSSVSDTMDVSSRKDTTSAEEATLKLNGDATDSKDDLSLKNASGNDTNQIVGASGNGIDGAGDQEQKGVDQVDKCSALEETKDHGTTISSLEDAGKYSEAKRRHKSERKYFGNTCEFARLTKSSRNTNVIKQTSDMDLEDGTVDALEVARLVAKEVEREVVGYYERSGSSSSERTSSGGSRQPDSPESINGGQDVLQTDAAMNELPTMKNVSPEASDKDPSTISASQDTKLKNHVHDMDSSQVTDAVRELEINTEKSGCGFDLNQEFSSEDLENQVGTISNPVSVVSASRAVMASGMPAAPLQFEGTLGWKGSAATSAFRPASPRRASDSEKALSGGGTSSGSRQRQDFLDFDLNVAEAGGGDDKVVIPVSGKQNVMFRGLPSGESSVELSPKRSEILKFDLNQMGDGDVPASEWKIGGRIPGPQNCRRSPSPASSSSCIQPPMRNFDLNDNPSNCNNLSDQRHFLGESSFFKVNPYTGPPDESVISIMGTKVKKNTFPPQPQLPFSNGRASEPVMDASLLRGGGAFMGLGPSAPYAQSVYGYNGLAMGPAVPFPSGPMYGPSGPIPYMFDSRGAPVMPQIIGSTSAAQPSYCHPSLVMNMVNATPGSNGAGPLRPNLDLNSGYAVEGANRDPAFFRQLFVPGQGRPLDEQLRDNFRPFGSGSSGGKRKEPDSGWELYPTPTNYKHHQPPHL